MHIIHDIIGSPKIASKKKSDNSAIIIITPLASGFGATLGNALRRVLLSSVPGSAVSGIKVDGVSHEYSTLSGVKESILDFCLNLKKVVIQKTAKDPEIISISKDKVGDVFASDIKKSSSIEILNPELKLTSITNKNSKVKADIKILKGVGYLSATDQQKMSTDSDNWIYLDVNFSPIVRVRYDVLAERVGDNTNLDRLELEIKTDGSITPEDSFRFASEILRTYFNYFQSDDIPFLDPDFISKPKPVELENDNQEEEEEKEPESYTPIETFVGLKLVSVRTANALVEKNDIGSIEQLIKYPLSKIETLPGIGPRGIKEIISALESRGLSLAEEE